MVYCGMLDLTPTINSTTPWGPAQSARTLAPGIVLVTTAGHGGVWLSRDRWYALTATERAYARRWAGDAGWLEEDCAIAIAIARWPEAFPGADLDRARAEHARIVGGGA
jgi:hypothetical protein